MKNSIKIIYFSGIVLSLILTSCRPGQSSTTPSVEKPETVAPTNIPETIEPSPIPDPTKTDVPVQVVFEESDCMFQLPTGLEDGNQIRCGYLQVPENRTDPKSSIIQLAVAILSPENGATNPDPILYLEGGPGGSPLEYLYLTFEKNFKPVLETGREIILLDQRGVGYSIPALDCPKLNDLNIELLDNEKDGKTLSDAEMNALILGEYEECTDELRKLGELSNYDTDANTADIEELRKALGIEKINLWGVSYGTRLALEMMRDYPDNIRSVVLDSVLPPEIDPYAEQPANTERAFNVFFTGCQSSLNCANAYPNLESTYLDTVKRLNENPAQIPVTNVLSGEKYEAVIDGTNLTELMFQFLYDTEIIKILPKLITDINQGNYDLLGLLIGSILATQDAISDGMHFTVQCAEEFPFTSPEKIASEAAKYPDFLDLYDEKSIETPFDICEKFNVEKADASATEAVQSDLPTLVMAGEYDPITPPSWGRRTADNISESYYFEFPGHGHGTSMVEGCPTQMMIEFFENPNQSPNSTCISQLTGPEFLLPISTQVNLIPYSNSEFNIQGSVPEGWQEANPGVFTRGSSAVDGAVVLFQSAPTSADELLDILVNSFKLSETPDVVGERKANNLIWKLYNFSLQGFSVDMAITEKDGQGIVVLLQSTPDERENLYKSIYLPMIDNARPLT